MLPGRVLRAGVLLVVLGTAGAAWAEGVLSPLAEMRAAAEALADVEPDGVRPQRTEIPGLRGARSGEPRAAEHATAVSAGEAERASQADRASARAALHAAIRSAVHDEVAREVQGLGRAPGAVAPPGKAAAAPGESARGEAERASDAAKQAQQARLNRAVGLSRGQGQGRGNKPLVAVPPATLRPGR